MKLWIALAVAALCLLCPSLARAGDCAGPEECCITDRTKVTVKLPEHIRTGLRVTHLREVSERGGSWTGEVSLVTRWPAGGLRPELVVRNASGDLATSVDESVRQGDLCYRERRIGATFSNWFRLRRFPFDSQLLRLLLEERALTDEDAIWEPDLWPNLIAIDAYRELSGWRVEGYPQLEVKRSSFSAVPEHKGPRLLIISTPIERVSQFYLTRYFLPLFLIVALAYGLFWIKPDDLGSAASVGITCMLAIITFQITQADTLPRVPYLTLADRVYTACYLATAGALGIVLWESYVTTGGKLDAALRVDKRMRRWFPVGFAALVGISIALGWSSHQDNPDADIPGMLAPKVPPAGEK